MDDSLTDLYPFIVKDHMFFLECSKPILKYDEIILNNMISAKKGIENTNNKLGNEKFMKNASEEVINNEKNKQIDFNMKWYLCTKSYLLYENS